MRSQMPVHHLLVWLAAGAACWCLLAAAALLAPQALLAVGALVALPFLRRPRSPHLSGAGESVRLRVPAVETARGRPERDAARVLVAQSA